MDIMCPGFSGCRSDDSHAALLLKTWGLQGLRGFFPRFPKFFERVCRDSKDHAFIVIVMLLNRIVRVALVAACPVPTFASCPRRGMRRGRLMRTGCKKDQEGIGLNCRLGSSTLHTPRAPRPQSDVALASVAKSMSGDSANIKAGLQLRTLRDYLGQQRLPSQ